MKRVLKATFEFLIAWGESINEYRNKKGISRGYY